VTFSLVAGRVWVFPFDPDPDNVQPGVTVIADPRGSVVVDAGNSPGRALVVQEALRSSGLPEPRWLVYTHSHWDHVWGACAWPSDLEVVAHAAALPVLAAEAERPWSHAYLRACVEDNPRLGPSFRARAWAMPSWDGFRVVPPTRTFADTLTLPTGVELRHVGGNHSEDSIVVVDPESRVMLLGDAFYPPPFHLREEADGPDLALLRRLLSDEVDWYVEAHDSPARREDVEAYLVRADEAG
jgi:glyoxylase-like metal-dependent hydrolase (beta-lactamase superfamily II)